MTRMQSWAAFLLVALASGAAAAADPVRARSEQPLGHYLSDEDYPAEAVRLREQGAVGYRLKVGADGRAAGCAVTSSSGSSSLDSATCRLMTERPRFTPARDSSGKAVADTVEGRIVWRLPNDPPGRPQAVLALWTSCLLGEAAKLALRDLPAAEIASIAYPPCSALEAREIGTQVPLDDQRKAMVVAIEQLVLRPSAMLREKGGGQR